MASQLNGLCSVVNVWTFPFLLLLLPGLCAKEYCFYDDFKVSCPKGRIIVFTDATYGRMQQGRCITDDFGHIGCQADVLNTLDTICSGLAKCSVGNVPVTFKDINRCPQGIFTYLDATSSCIEVFTPPTNQCRSSSGSFTPPPPGILSNSVVEKTGCGSEYHPWIIEVAPTQKINLTLHDFGTFHNQDQTSCRQYAIVREPDIEEDVKLCGGIQRVKHALLSHGSKIEISLAPPPDINGIRFLLKYEAIGCKEPVHPSDMWMKVERDHVTIGCYTSKTTWQLTCAGSEWQGTIGNCSTVITPDYVSSNGTWVMWPSETSNILTFLVAICAIVITIAILVVALLYTNRRSPPAIALGSLDEPYEAKDIAFFKKDPRDNLPESNAIAVPPLVDINHQIPRESCVSVPLSTSDSDTYASENATLPLRANDMEDFDSTLHPPLPQKLRPSAKPPIGDIPPPELPPKCPPKVGGGRRGNTMGPYTKLNLDNSFNAGQVQPPYKTLQQDLMNQSRPLPPVPINPL